MKYFPIAFFLLSYVFAHAQRMPATNDAQPLPLWNNTNVNMGHTCGGDVSRAHIMGLHPQLLQKEHAMNDNIMYASASRDDDPTEIQYITVVVHIVHQNGPENISDEQVMQGIDDLNDAFANTGVYYDPAAEDTRIRFCLAQQDPVGLPTTGITRGESELTNLYMENSDIQLKDLVRWDPERYLNIWLVKEITSFAMGSGVAGYAYLPYAHGLPEDGIVNEASWFGSSTDHSKVHIHEVGHYLGLYHTFEGGCTNNDCTTDNDRVCDTPPDQSTNSAPCVTAQNSCSSDEDDTSSNNPFRSTQLGGLGDQDDMLQNFMDYSYQSCQTLFTPGQSERMNAALQNERASLLASNGCITSCGISAINVNLESDVFIAGQPMTATHVGYNVVEVSYQWSFNGDILATDSTLQYSFSNAQIGSGYLVLSVINIAEGCSREDSVFITVKCNPPAFYTMTPQYAEVNESIVFDGENPLATSYAWYLDGVPAGNNSTLNTTFSTPGAHHLYLVTGNGLCTDTSAVDYFAVGSCAGGQNNHWIFAGSHVDFSSGSPVATSLPATAGQMGTIEGMSTMSDQNGELLFYSDGISIFNRLYQPFCTGLGAGFSSTQGVQIVPDPANDYEYYVFTAENFGGDMAPTGWGFAYIKVNMNLNDGLGGVSTSYIQLMPEVCEMQTAVRHCNGHDIWVICHDYGSNNFYSYLLSDTGISAPVLSPVGADRTGGGWSMGALVASPQGNMLVATAPYSGATEFFHFDANTGEVIDDYTLLNNALWYPSYGVAFSPDGSKAYYVNENDVFIRQVDLSSGDIQMMQNSITIIGISERPYYMGSMQLGPDGKIYVGQSSSYYMDVITNPNEAGEACGFVNNGIYLPGGCIYGIQNVLSSPFATAGPQITGLTQVCTNVTDIHYTASCGNNIWSLQGNNELNIISETEVSIDFLLPGVDTLMCTTSDPCVGVRTDTLLIHVGTPDLFLGNDTTVCSTGSLTLGGAGQYTAFTWSNGQHTPTIEVSTTGNYWLAATSIGGCIARDTIHVVKFNETFNVPEDTVQICGASDNYFHIPAQQGNFTHHWWSADGPTADEQMIYLYMNTDQWSFPIFYVNEHGCVDEDVVVVQARPDLPQFDLDDVTLCPGTIEVVHIDESICPECGYTWPDGSHGNEYTIYSPLYYQWSSYWVLRYDSLCNALAGAAIGVQTLHPEYLLLPDTLTICPDIPVTLFPGWYFEDNYEWQDGSTDSVFVVTEPGMYWVNTNTVCGVYSDTTRVGMIDPAVYSIGLPDTIYTCSGSLPVQLVDYTNTNIYSYYWSNGFGGYAYEEGPITVVAYSICGALHDSTFVDVKPSPVNLLPHTLNVCEDEEVYLVQPPGQLNTWDEDIVADSIFVNENGVHHFTLDMENGCSISDSVTVFFDDLYFIVSDTTLCEGNTLSITPVTNAVYYLFDNEGMPETLLVSDIGTHYIYAANYVCSKVYTFDVAPGGPSSLILPDTVAACPNQFPVWIEAEGDVALQYEWSNGGITEGIEAEHPGWYILQATYGCGQRTDSTFLDILDAPVVILPEDTILCENGELILSGNSAYENEWSTGEEGDNIIVDQVGTYTLISTGPNGCFSFATTEVIESGLFIDLDETASFCANSGVLITATTNGSGYSWSNGETSTSTIANEEGELTFTASLDNCIYTASVSVTQWDTPVFTLGNDTAVITSSYTIIGPDGFESYDWNVAGQNSPTLTVTQNGTYFLTITDENGCTYTDAIVITLNATAIPTNEDIGSFINVPDVLYYGKGLTATYHDVSVQDVKVFDAVGRQVSHSRTFPLVWDGTVNGTEAAPAMYFYMINYSDANGKHVKKGNVLMAR